MGIGLLMANSIVRESLPNSYDNLSSDNTASLSLTGSDVNSWTSTLGKVYNLRTGAGGPPLKPVYNSTVPRHITFNSSPLGTYGLHGLSLINSTISPNFTIQFAFKFNTDDGFDTELGTLMVATDAATTTKLKSIAFYGATPSARYFIITQGIDGNYTSPTNLFLTRAQIYILSMVYSFNGSIYSYSIYIDNTYYPALSKTNAQNPAWINLTLGNNSQTVNTAAHEFRHKICEVVVYNQALSADLIALSNAALRLKYDP